MEQMQLVNSNPTHQGSTQQLYYGKAILRHKENVWREAKIF